MADNLGTPEFAEEAAILRFYNIDTLEPETWVDEVYGSRPNSHLGSANKHFSRTPESSPNPQQDFVDENDLQVQDDSDPLGLKQSIFSGYGLCILLKQLYLCADSCLYPFVLQEPPEYIPKHQLDGNQGA